MCGSTQPEELPGFKDRIAWKSMSELKMGRRLKLGTVVVGLEKGAPDVILTTGLDKDYIRENEKA